MIRKSAIVNLRFAPAAPGASCRMPMNRLFLVSMIALLSHAGAWAQSAAPARPALRLYAGAGLRLAVEKLVTAFTAQTGIRVEPDYGGSGLILARAREDQEADLFLPGDAWYVDRLQTLASNVAQRVQIAYFLPVIVVPRGNPKNVRGLADLTRSDLRVGLGNADACQVGRVARQILDKAGIDPAKIHVQESLTVNELGVWVKMKAVDAAIVWDAIATNITADVQTIAIPPVQRIVSDVVLARLRTSLQPDAAQRFLDFVQSPAGRRILEQEGYCTTNPLAR